MNKTFKKVLSAILAVAMLLSISSAAFAADTSSEEYKFFSELDCTVDSTLNSAVQAGNWSTAKTALLNYYTQKFSALDYITFDSAASLYYKNALYDTLCFSETMIDEKTVTTDESLITYHFSSAYVLNNYVLMTFVNSDYGISIASKESGRAPVLSVQCSDGTYNLTATGDAYIRATSVGASNSNASTAFGSTDPNHLWAMHQVDTANQMPYNNNEMRTYISFDLSSISGKSIQSADLKVYAQVKKPDSSAAPAGTTLPLMLMSGYYQGWSESTLKWNDVKSQNAFGTFSWNGFDGGIIYSESLYGKAYANLGVQNEYINSSSRFYEVSSLIQKGYFTEAKDMLIRFCEQTYDVIKNGTGFPVGRPLEPANRMLELPYIYRSLLTKGLLTAEENYIFLRWTLQNINNIDDEISGSVFLNGGTVPNPNITANWGAWHITGFYNGLAFWNEFKDSNDWKTKFETRLSVISDTLIDTDGSYREVTFGYPTMVVQWFSNMLNYMSIMNYESEASGSFKSQLIKMTKYLLDCTYPNGKLPHYGDGSGGKIKDTINQLLKINYIENDDSLDMSNLLWYLSGGTKGIEPEYSSVYKESKLVADRTGWGLDDSMLFMNAKAGGKHAHSDSLSILFYSRGRNFLEDVGTLTYDSASDQYNMRIRSSAHNTVEVDDEGQDYNGWNYVDEGYDGSADNINLYSNSGASTVRAYTTSNKNQNVTHYRNVTFIKSLHDLILVNDLLVPGSSTKKHTYTQNWHSDPNGLSFTYNNTKAYTNYSSGANMMICQADSSSTASQKQCYDENSSSKKSDYIEFNKSGKGDMSFNTAIYTYNGTQGGVAIDKITIKKNLFTSLKDSAASAMRIKLYDSTGCTNLTNDVLYYNAFESGLDQYEISSGVSTGGNAIKFKTDSKNAFFVLDASHNVTTQYISGGKSLNVYTGSSTNVASVETSANVTDLTAEYDAATSTLKIDSSDDGVKNRTTNVTVKFSQLGSDAIKNVELNGVKLIDGENVTISGNIVYFTSTSLYFDFKNDTAAVSRYSQTAYGNHNYDTGFWAVNSSRNSAPAFNYNGEGTLSTTLTQTGLESNYIQTSSNGSLSNGSNCLSYNISNAEVVQMKVRFENCQPKSNTNVTFLTASSYGSSDFNWKSNGVNFTFTNGEYAVINIPVTSEIKALGSIITFRINFNNLAAVNSGSDCKAVIDYIYIGKQIDTPSGYTHFLNYYVDGNVYAQQEVAYARPYGNLIIPEKQGFDFEGWFTQAEGGTLITAETVVSGTADENLYAHWSNNLVELTYDNEYNFNEWRNNSSSTALRRIGNTMYTQWSEGDLTADNGKIVFTTNANLNISGNNQADDFTMYGPSASYYNISVKPNTQYTFSLDITTQSEAQCFIFPYNSAYQQIRSDTVNGVNWNGEYISSDYIRTSKHLTKTFTTTDSTAYLQIRVGNSSGYEVTSTFANIRITETSLSNSITYSAAGKLVYTGLPVGELMQPVRSGYSFDGWYIKGTDTKVTSDYIPTGNLQLESRWSQPKHTVTFKNYDGTVLQTAKYNAGDLPSYSGTPTRDSDDSGKYTFSGWTPSVSSVSGDAVYTAQFNVTAHSYSYADNGSAGHSYTCVNCGYVKLTENHHAHYEYNSLQHWFTCSDCGFCSEAADHVYDENGKCTFCDYAVIGTCDYTAVDKAIESIPSRLVYYSEDSLTALENAVNSVKRELNITRQSEVDAMADAINSAIENLTPRQFTVTVPQGCTVTQKFDESVSPYYYVATVQAPEFNNGDFFTYWEDDNGVNAGTYRTYSFFVTEDVSLTPVYVPESEYLSVRNEKIVATRVVDCRNNLDGETYSILSEYALSDSSVDNVNGHGIIYTTDSSLAGSLTLDNVDTDGIFSRSAVSSASSYTGLYETAIKCRDENGTDVNEVWAVAYVIYDDGSSVFYSDVKHVTIDDALSVFSTDAPLYTCNELVCIQTESDEIITYEQPVKAQCPFIAWIKWFIGFVVNCYNKVVSAICG